MLRTAVAAIIAARLDVVRNWLEEKVEAQADQIGAVEDEVEIKRRYFGLRFWVLDGIEGSGLCVFFSEFAGEPNEFEVVYGEGGSIDSVEPDDAGVMVPATPCPPPL